MRFLGHQRTGSTLLYTRLKEAIFSQECEDFLARLALNAQDACRLVETGFEYVTGEYGDGGKILRKRA